jgi:DNA-directed RNA polymerase specialized sigma24 family protein
VPVSTVKTRLYRGLGRLRVLLEREGIREARPLPAPAP